ncbi:MAG: Ig-like domain-containing protein [Candidatus Symbiothrix sp.]|jgi:hypothetical protein|nr:Ig-like domain-containing protein [Candidatus Symbiothrix sp.]
MANNNLTARKGQCINYGNCPKADSHEVIEVNLGDDFICPECEGSLIDLPQGQKFPWKIVIVIVAVLAIGAGIYFAVPFIKDKFSSTSGGETEESVPNDIIVTHPITPDSITINKYTLLFEKVDTTEQLMATVYPDNVPKKNKKVIWQSEDSTVAIVDTNGGVTAVGAGKAEITAYTGNGFSATCNVTVSGGKEEEEQVGEKEDNGKGRGTSGGGSSGTVKKHGTISVSGGSYIGELKNGQLHGRGTIRYTSRTLIDSRDRKQRYAEAGQSITGDFYNGHLVQGKLFDNNGNQIEDIIVGTFK